MVIESARPAGRFGARVWTPGPLRKGRRRGLTIVAALLVVMMIAAAVVWFGFIPRYRPELRPGERFGIDVSNHQGPIEWSEVADDDISAVYMKATEGRDFVDKRFAENWSGADEAGIKRGAYHFFTLCSPGAAQAANFLRVVPTDPDALPPAVDLEFASCEERPDVATVQRELTTFITTVESAVGKKVILYALPPFVRAYPLPEDFVDRDRWVRRIGKRPATDNWTVWQVSFRSRIHGIGEPTDLDVWRTSPS